MSNADWKPPHVIPPVLSDEYLVTLSTDSDESTTAIYAQPWSHKPAGWFKMENGGLTRVNVIAWDFMPKPFRG